MGSRGMLKRGGALAKAVLLSLLLVPEYRHLLPLFGLASSDHVDNGAGGTENVTLPTLDFEQLFDNAKTALQTWPREKASKASKSFKI